MPRSTSLPATIAAPAPTSSHFVRLELSLYLAATVTAFECDEPEWQARCRDRGVPEPRKSINAGLGNSPTFPLFQRSDVPDVMPSMPGEQAKHLLERQ